MIDYHKKEENMENKTSEKNYTKISFMVGDIASAVKVLNDYKKRGELVYGVFNNHKLYSDIDDLDSAYLKITGKTKAQFDEDYKTYLKNIEDKKRKHKQAIPELTKEWIEKGNSILDEKYHESWAKVVPIRLDDLYEGMELGCTLEIVEKLNNNASFLEVENLFMSQNHSGASGGLVLAMVDAFCDSGGAFWRLYAKKMESII